MVGIGVNAQRLAVTDFGAAPDSRKDATAAVQRAILACQRLTHAVLVFPAGRYDFFSDSAVRKAYFISNTSSEEECPSKVKTIGMAFADQHGLSIEGNGSLFVFHGKMTTFVFDHCSDISLQHVTMDFERPTMSEFTVVRATPSSVEVAVHQDSWYRLDSGRLSWYGENWSSPAGPDLSEDHYFCIRVDTSDQSFHYANGEYSKLMMSKISSAGDRRLRFDGSFDTSHYPVGSVFTVRDPIRDEVGAFIVSSKNVVLRDVTMHYMHGLGIVGQYSSGITLTDVRIVPWRGRQIASFADGMHFSGCRGLILIDHCIYRGMHDDEINVHGTHLKIVRQPAADELVVRFMHPQTYGFDAFFAGDTISFVHPTTLIGYGSARILEATRLSEREILLKLDHRVAASVGDVVENITWTPSLTVRNCVFSGTNTRGLLVTTRRKVIITHNQFNRLGMHAILIADDALSWYESGNVLDVLIDDNKFLEIGYNSLPNNYPIAIAPENHELHGDAPVHKHIRIEGNRFFCTTGAVLSARSVEGLWFVRNRVDFVGAGAGAGVRGAGARGARVGSSASDGAGVVPGFKLVACKKVVIEGNQIDPALPGGRWNEN